MKSKQLYINGRERFTFVLLLITTSIIVSGCNPFKSDNGSDITEQYAIYSSLNPKVSTSVSVVNRAGSVAPSVFYQDDLLVCEQSILVNRSGGSSVVLGSWLVNLTPDEVRYINNSLTMISAGDSDQLSDVFPIGGGSGHVFVGGNLKFYYGESGIPGDNKYHQYSINVKNLNDYISNLIILKGYGVAYIGNT